MDDRDKLVNKGRIKIEIELLRKFIGGLTVHTEIKHISPKMNSIVLGVRSGVLAKTSGRAPEVVSDWEIALKLPNGYPLEGPVVHTRPPLWHPHVFENGILSIEVDRSDLTLVDYVGFVMEMVHLLDRNDDNEPIIGAHKRGAVMVHRQSRLAGDYDEVMQNRWPEEMDRLEKFVATLDGQVEIKHIDPAYRKFVFDIYIPTLGLVNGREQDIDKWELTITVPAQYPSVHPKLTTRPPLFLPHAGPDDGWLCVENHRLDSTIAEYLEYAIKMATGQDVINTHSPANTDAMAQRNRIQERVRYDPWANAPQGSGSTRVLSAPTEFVPQQALSQPSGRARVIGPGQANAAGVRVIGQGQNNGAEGVQQQEQGPIFRVRARR